MQHMPMELYSNRFGTQPATVMVYHDPTFYICESCQANLQKLYSNTICHCEREHPEDVELVGALWKAHGRPNRCSITGIIFEVPIGNHETFISRYIGRGGNVEDRKGIPILFATLPTRRQFHHGGNLGCM